MCAEIFQLGRFPFVLALLMGMTVACVVLFGSLYLCGAQVGAIVKFSQP
jgi:hypothetical protein